MKEKNPQRSILIFRALQLGDMLCSVPALRTLRKAWPQAHITIMGLPWMQSFTERFADYLDEFIWFPGYPGLPEQPPDRSATLECIQHVMQRKFDLAIQMHGNGSIINPLVELFGADENAGYYRREDYIPAGYFMEYPQGIHEVHRHLRLMEHMGLQAAGDHLEFPITRSDEEQYRQAGLSLVPGSYICVHPGSRGAWRQWPIAHFARLADDCANKGWQIVLTGTREEMPIVEELASQMESEPLIAAGKTSLGAIAVLLQNAGGLISNCTGVSHIAAALKLKSIVISMDGEPERWAPLDTRLHKTFDWTKEQDPGIIRKHADELFSSAP